MNNSPSIEEIKSACKQLDNISSNCEDQDLLLNAIDASTAYWVANLRDVPFISKDWLESILAKDTIFAYRYAVECLKNRFEKGEEKIGEDPEYSYYYAENVIKNKLPEKMHIKMLAFAIKEPENIWTKKYFELIKNKEKVDKNNLTCTIKNQEKTYEETI